MTSEVTPIKIWPHILIPGCLYEEPSVQFLRLKWRGLPNTPARPVNRGRDALEYDIFSPVRRREDCLKLETKTQKETTECTYNGSLQYGASPSPSCMRTSPQHFWRGFFEALLGVFANSHTSIKNSTILVPVVSHQKRLRHLIIPTINGFHIANGAVFKITFEVKSNPLNAVVAITVLEEGIPDKKRKYIKKNQDVFTSRHQDQYTDKLQVSSVIKWGFSDAAKKLDMLHGTEWNTTFVLYIIRHGNAVHNSPFSDYTVWDSPLTVRGIYQAARAGQVIREDFETMKKPGPFYLVPAASSLKRAQQTLLIVLLQVLDQLPVQLQVLLRYFTALTVTYELGKRKKMTADYSQLKKAFHHEEMLSEINSLRTRIDNWLVDSRLPRVSESPKGRIFTFHVPMTASMTAWIKTPLREARPRGRTGMNLDSLAATREVHPYLPSSASRGGRT